MFVRIIIACLAALSVQYPTKPACDEIDLPSFSDFKILTIESNDVYNYTSSPAAGAVTPLPSIDFHNISISFTHGTDVVWAYFWLPLEGWNGRYVTGGGGGLAAGNLALLPPFLAQGYAAATSDGGLSLNNTIEAGSGEWILNASGEPNTELMLNFAYRAIHDVTVLGKAVVTSYYGKAPAYSYYSGCSTGGRQGYSSAHFFPDDFDGVQANAPVINSTRYNPADIWPQVVMDNLAVPPNCVFDFYQEKIISACDSADGLADGIITDPTTCTFDASSLIGEVVSCAETGTDITISDIYAEVVGRVLEGPRTTAGEFVWFGVVPGSSFHALANTTKEDGKFIPFPFPAAKAMVSWGIFQDANYDTSKMTFADFDLAFKLSVERTAALFPFEHADMHTFQKHGKKMLTWHGQADQYVNPLGTIEWHEALEATHGGVDAVNDFYRLFLAPGAQHCGSDVGPAPSNPLAALAAWVENGTAPETLPASTKVANGTIVSRDLCLWPKLPYYKGEGDPNAASSFHCK